MADGKHGDVPLLISDVRQDRPHDLSELTSVRQGSCSGFVMDGRIADSPTVASKVNATVNSQRHRLSVIVFAVCALLLAFAASRWSELLSAEFRMLRGSFNVVLLIYLFLLNIRGWRAGNISYIKMFELDNDWTVWNSVSGVSMHTGFLWSFGCSVTLLLCALNRTTAVSYVPVMLWVALFTYFVWPFKSYFFESRMWMINVLYRILVSPIHEVSFADFWVADQLNSLASVFVDFEFSMCFLVGLGSYSVADLKEMPVCRIATWNSQLILAALPAWWRFAQCLRCYYDTKEIPHLLNAGKYFSTFPTIVAAGMLATAQLNRPHAWQTGPEFHIWLYTTVFRAVYVYVWDVRMDWGFFKCNSFPCSPVRSKHPFLRTHLLFSPHWVYYGMILLDLVLRFSFLVKLCPVIFGMVPGDVFFSILLTMEVVRRFLWNFFRLEYEQTKSMPEDAPTKSRQFSAGNTPTLPHEM
ncbi:solute carrier family 53 member 1-like [Sycon ciliatum]|uniref:solute carrier family 53 member 1-like n=1 Tax=Sycon ciliatum TaxID=27933 RepID=UPI0031F6C5D3